MDIKRKPSRRFTDEECFEILKRYDPQAYEYYSNNAWFFGCCARRYAEYLYAKNHLVGLFAKYHIRHERIGDHDAYRVYGNFEGFSSVRIANNLLELDGRITDEEDFERWCAAICC